MRRVLTEQPFIIEKAVSGGSPVATDHEILIATGASTNSEILNLRLRNTNTNFDDTDEVDGFYNPRIWIENLPVYTNFEMEYELAATPEYGTTVLTSGIAVPRVVQDISNIAKATYWQAGTESLEWIKLQLQIGTPFATRYNSEDWEVRSDPRLVIQWDREALGRLDPSMPSPNSDHLWEFSQVDLYLNHVYNGKTQRWLVGWCQDEDFALSKAKETVEFTKGKPSAIAARFYSKIMDQIKLTIASADPFIWEIAMAITPVLTNGYYRFTEKNSQRPIGKFYFSMEWNTNAGHKVRFIVPNGQIYLDGDKTPGAGEISKQGLIIIPTASSCSRDISYMDISKSIIGQAELCLGYDTGTA